MSELDGVSEFLPEGMDQELLQELEKQSLEQIQKLRKHQRFEIRVPIHLKPGNASSTDPVLVGETVDVSDGGCAGTGELAARGGDEGADEAMHDESAGKN